MDYLANAGHYLVSVLLGIIVVVLLLRVMLQLVRANYYNPLSQFVLKLTNPVLMPLGKLIPRWRNVDVAALLLAWIVKAVSMVLLALLNPRLPGFTLAAIEPLSLLLFALVGLLDLAILIMMVAMFIIVIFSWIAPHGNNPIQTVAQQLTQSILRPFRRLIPPIAGFDFSVFFALIALQLARMLIIAPLNDLISRL